MKSNNEILYILFSLFFRQLQYDDDCIYDVSLQMDRNKINDLELIVPGHNRSHKHKYNIINKNRKK